MRLFAGLLTVSCLATGLGGCAVFDTRSGREPVPGSGGYYKDDGPGAQTPADLAAIPDAVPRPETPMRAKNRPYTVLGRSFVPLADARGFRQEGMASWYGRRFHGKPTASGEPYDMYAMTAAHPTLPIPSYARVSNPANGRSVVVRVNDRGPFHSDRVIDLSYTAAWKLDILKGVTPVVVEAIDPEAPTESTAVATLPLPAAPLIPEPDGTTWLQLGAFGNAAGAAAFADELRRRLGNALPEIVSLPAGDLFKVQAGPFASVAQADQAAALLARELGLQPFRISR